MKVVIPTNSNNGLNDTIANHFGRCKTYTFLDENGKVIEIIDNTSEHMGGKGLPPELMKKHGADILLCRDLGMRALKLCQELEIDVYTSDVETVKEIFNQWKENKLTKATSDDVCGH
jgi:predicted Fe-Mo cluster-binding NifX family protein